RAGRTNVGTALRTPERLWDRAVVGDHERLPRDPTSHRVIPAAHLGAESVRDRPETDEQLPEVVRGLLLHPDPAEDRPDTDTRRPGRDRELPVHVRPLLAHLVAGGRVDLVRLLVGEVVREQVPLDARQGNLS